MLKLRPPTGRISLVARITFPTCCAHYPDGSDRCILSITSLSARPSPFEGRVGIRIGSFEACSGFIHITARWIAQPPKAAFVTRLRTGWLPGQFARLLPDQSTTFRVASSSTSDTRLARRTLKLPQVWSVKIPHLKQDLDVLNLPLFHEQEFQRLP